ncbi:hypothetical protein TRVA0_018S02366 [Trichomonascus vanleenenianus]|uniref:glutathione synthase n=1 Tax=Trichomonascus vanleenenianus TaxID=2268995 RepID=UPI003ECA6963
MTKYPPEVSPAEEKETVNSITHWAMGHGLMMLTEGNAPTAVHAPVTVYPTPFPKAAFEKARKAQKPFNELYYSVCANEEWLVSVITDLATFDPDFTGKLLEVHLKATKSSQPRQPLTGGLFRSDYIPSDKGEIRQVEFNSVSVSFPALSTRVSELHNYLIKNQIYGIDYDPATVPVSPSLSDMAAGLATMHRAYVKQAGLAEDEPAAVLMVVQPNERNVLDQRLVEYELNEKHTISCYRATLEEIQDKFSLVEGNRLVHNGTGAEISVVYYRSGYGPGDYPTSKEWEARLFLECSYAINCPSALTQLSGAKKIQQLLTEEKVIRKVAPQLSKADIDVMLETFVAIHPLDDETPEGRHARTLAFDHPTDYVLKPQREGGGNNIYKDNIPGFLMATPKANWPAYILMELIKPANMSNKILRNGEVYNGEIVSELGVFGSCLWNRETKRLLHNEECGWLLRSKVQSSNEGGVAAGFGCVDGVYLV